MKTVGGFIANTSVDDLAERISFVNYTTKRGERGDFINQAEFERCRVWAKILPMTAKISDAPPEQTNRITYRVMIRYRTDIKPDDEILWRGRRLKLLTPPFDAESRKIYLVMDCEEVIEDEQSS